MPYREIFFEKNQPLHILSRAVEDRKIFAREEDCYRFIFSIYAANIGRPTYNIRRIDIIKTAQALLRGEEISSKFIIKKHPPLVYLLDFALVITHHHFYLFPNSKNGVPLFMKKLKGGFAKYFNLKYSRQGSLFGARYKCIPIQTESQSDAIIRYISIINPLDVYQPGWREKGLKNLKEAYDFLKNYQFSSFPDRIGKRKSKILASDEIWERYFLKMDLGGKRIYEKFVKNFLKQKSKLLPLFLE